MVTIKDSYVEFNFFRPDARAVFLAGDFNDWCQDEVEMTPMRDGCWKTRMNLPSGEYKFRYYADGQWYTDYAAFGVEPGQFGLDSIVRIPARPLKMPEITTPAKIKIAA